MIDHSLTKWIIKGARLCSAIRFSPNQLCLKSTVWYWQHFKAPARGTLSLSPFSICESLSLSLSLFYFHQSFFFCFLSVIMNLDLCHPPHFPKSSHNAKLHERGFRLWGISVCLRSFFRPVRFTECKLLSDYSNLLLTNLKAGLTLLYGSNHWEMNFSSCFFFFFWRKRLRLK